MTELGGYAGKILRINLTKREAKMVDLDRSLVGMELKREEDEHQSRAHGEVQP